MKAATDLEDQSGATDLAFDIAYGAAHHAALVYGFGGEEFALPNRGFKGLLRTICIARFRAAL